LMPVVEQPFFVLFSFLSVANIPFKLFSSIIKI